MPSSELRDQLQRTLGSNYSLEQELVGGGMSHVFLATETALGRKVVVKVVLPELAAGVSAERFAREIRLAARLQQANIVPLLAAGQAGDVPFYTMPFVEGLSLRERLRQAGPLPIPQTVSILRDIARALGYAHDHSVVHRDIKPENVLLSGDAAVVTDFGIAKAITVSRTGAGAGTITQVGAGIGTPAYMAPEQVSGDPALDHRADFYSFGCVAYELLSGRPPFHGLAVQGLLAAHLTATPDPVTSLRADTPPGLAALIARCLEKAPDRRPQSAREILGALESVALAAPMRARSRARGSRLAIAVVVVVIVAGGYALAARRGAPAPGGDLASLAVLPFVNVGGDSAQDYLADGMSDELATAIGKLPGVRVAARSAAFRYRGRRDLDVRDLGRSLGVKYVVQGTVRRAGSQLRVSAQLNDASNGVEMWADRFDRDEKDVFSVEDDITRAITDALRPRFVSARAAPVPRAHVQGTGDPEAYDLYLRGEFLLRRREVPQAAQSFERALARDSTFARAYAGLSQALELFPYFAGRSAEAVGARAMQAAHRALAFDSSLAEAHTSLALAEMHNLRWDEAGAEHRLALALDSNDANAHFQFGRHLFYRERIPEALAQWERAKALDPYSSLVSCWIALALQETGRSVEALAEAKRALELDPTSVVVLQNTSEVSMLAGRGAEARAIADRMPREPPWLGVIAHVHARTGDADGARRMVREMEDRTPRPWFTESALAWSYLGLGDTTRALDALERATALHEIWPSFHRSGDWLYDPIRASARWKALLLRAGLPASPAAAPGSSRRP